MLFNVALHIVPMENCIEQKELGSYLQLFSLYRSSKKVIFKKLTNGNEKIIEKMTKSKNYMH